MFFYLVNHVIMINEYSNHGQIYMEQVYLPRHAKSIKGLTLTLLG